MRVYQSKSFEEKVKKMFKPEKDLLDREINKIVENPCIGKEKKGDLRGVFVHKFKLETAKHKLETAQYLLAYRKIGEDLELVMIGPHENYYLDLKQYLKS
ncbi:MAG: type II toxin-antitoxin system RelE/ParE family toxin [Proteobacteria bacterium]|nr:type II toxin-antitoxin system RelE/ParE family toxin [Pseudomonadota bacterium]